jgi:hypothetical protein
MTDDVRAGIHVEAEQGDEARALAKAALPCVVVAAVIVAAESAGLGRDGMLDWHSPDFFPLPHFCAFVGLLLAAFFLVRADHEGDDGKVDGQQERAVPAGFVHQAENFKRNMDRTA